MILSKTALVLALGGAATNRVAASSTAASSTAATSTTTEPLPYCYGIFEDCSTADCTSPADILNPLTPDCQRLPDCPCWCDRTEVPDSVYCGSTSVIDPIDGANEVEKYAMEYFHPPVLVDNTFDRKTVSVREFLQPILPPPFPKTRLWGYGDPDFWNDENDPIIFHNPAASMEVWQNRPIKVAFLNDLVEDPVACRCSSDPEDCKPLKHILQDCAGHPVVDTLLHWANPGGPAQAKAACAEHDAVPEGNLLRTDFTDCTGANSYVYDGPVPNVAHVHGAHADPESDGFTEAWFLPKMNASSELLYPSNGNWFDTFGPTFDPVDVCLAGRDDGLEANTYRNDQPTATLFFHDHTLGMTRLNVMATSAGFYFIRDSSCVSISENKAGLKWYGESGQNCTRDTLPGPPPTAELFNNKNGSWYVKPPYADETIRELPIAIQDMSFYEDTDKGETRQFYPADHDNFLGSDDPADRWGCNNLNGNDVYLNHQVPNDPPEEEPISKPVGPIWNPEVFFDVAVVNGRAWPKQKVRPNRYRLRLLDACDSRALSLSAWAWPDVVNPPPSLEDLQDLGEELPIWVIGTEQSLLPGGPAKILSRDGSKGSVTKYNCGVAEPEEETPLGQGLLMQPGERYDAIIDFEGFKDYQVYLVNTGPDEPFKKFELTEQGLVDPADFNKLGQIMRFDVVLDRDEDDVGTSPDQLCFDENPGGVAKFDVQPNYRKVFLKEEVTDGESLGPLAAVLDNIYGNFEEGKGWAKPITENIPLNQVEEWDVINLSADAHPIHLHQVKFELVKRCFGIDPVFDPPRQDPPCQDGTGVLGYETGWKDAVISYPNVYTADDECNPNEETCEEVPPCCGAPRVYTEADGCQDRKIIPACDPCCDEPIGFTTTIKMKFDILGIYVWHCHILSHEDNEMMRPLCVYDPDDLTTLNNCCPKGLVYDLELWDSDNELECITPPEPCGVLNRKDCVKGDDECAWIEESHVCTAAEGSCSEIPTKKKCMRAGCSWIGEEDMGECANLPEPSTLQLRGKVEGLEDPAKMKSSAQHVGWTASATMAIGALVLFWI